MKEFIICGFIAIAAVVTGFGIGLNQGFETEQKKLGTAICKKLSGTYARLDGDPVCINPAGGILKFYD